MDHWIPRERADDKYEDRLLEKQRQTLLEMKCLRAHISGGLNQSWRNADPAAKASDLFNNSEKAEACWPTLLFMAVLTDVLGDRFPKGSDLKGLADFAEGLASFWEKFLSWQLSVESTKGSGVPNAER